MRLNAIYRYPVKGFPGEKMPSVKLSAGEGLPDDRRYAITNGVCDVANGDWLTCRSFFINSVNDGLLKYVNENPGESDADSVTLASPNGMRISWRKGDPESLSLANRKMAEFIAPLMPAHDLPVPVIAERSQLPGIPSGYWDFTDSAVSIMNPASLDAVAKAMGQNLDHRRLRGNLYVEGLPAWEEFAWLGKRIRIGKKGAEFDILRPAQRCPATSVNPETGERDLKVPDALAGHFGHAYCGVYAKCMKTGSIQKGDRVEIIGDASTSLEEAANPAAPDYKLWPKFATVVARTADGNDARLELAAHGPWPLPLAQAGQRMRVHIAKDLIGVARVEGQQDHTTVLHVEPSQTNDPATAYLLEKVKAGDRLIVTGPFGRS